jgi:gluconolactonase
MKPFPVLATILSVSAPAWGTRPGLPPDNPEAIVDLSTPEGVTLVRGQWRYAPARIVEADDRAPGPDMKADGPPVKTNDIQPHAGSADFDDSSWEVVAPPDLRQRRGTGRLCLCWYRIAVTIPDHVAGFETRGSTAVLELVVDDYAEVWVDGKLPLVLGESGGPLVSGWNAPQRVILARDARPGQKINVAILGVNGPISDPPANFVWIRSATLDFHRPERLSGITTVPVEVIRKDPAIDRLVPPGTALEKLAGGFRFTEGPVWIPASFAGAGSGPIARGYLLFSDPNSNVIQRWSPDGDLSVFRTKSGYTGMDIAEYTQPGSNGLALDRDGRLTVCEHGNRRVTRIEKNGSVTILADRYEGKRLNSPNDLVYRSDGALFFTDPPFGLPKFHDDPRRESPYTGVYCLYNGVLKLVSNDLTGPNGIAFSPDEAALYVSNWDTSRKVIMRYDAQPDGTLTHGSVFFDMTSAPGNEALDGLKVDREGNVYASGPGGVWIIAPTGRHLGTIVGPELPANFAWGDDDARTLYMTARTGLYRMRVGMPGAKP